jgi:hypothetical protein
MPRNDSLFIFFVEKLGLGAYPSSGKILYQSEKAEIFFGNIKMYPLKK